MFFSKKSITVCTLCLFALGVFSNFSSKSKGNCTTIKVLLPLRRFKLKTESAVVPEPEKKSTQIESSSDPIVNSFLRDK